MNERSRPCSQPSRLPCCQAAGASAHSPAPAGTSSFMNVAADRLGLLAYGETQAGETDPGQFAHGADAWSGMLRMPKPFPKIFRNKASSRSPTDSRSLNKAPNRSWLGPRCSQGPIRAPALDRRSGSSADRGGLRSRDPGAALEARRVRPADRMPWAYRPGSQLRLHPRGRGLKVRSPSVSRSRRSTCSTASVKRGPPSGRQRRSRYTTA